MENDSSQPTTFDELQIFGRFDDVDSHAFGDVPNELKISIAVGIAKKNWTKHCSSLGWLIPENDFICVAVEIALNTPFDDSFKVGQKINYLVQRLRMRLRNYIRDEVRQYKRVRLIGAKSNDDFDLLENFQDNHVEQQNVWKFRPLLQSALQTIPSRHQPVINDFLNGVPVCKLAEKHALSREGVCWIKRRFCLNVLKEFARQSPEILERFVFFLYDYPNAILIEDYLQNRRELNEIVRLIRNRNNVDQPAEKYVFETLKRCMERLTDGH